MSDRFRKFTLQDWRDEKMFLLGIMTGAIIGIIGNILVTFSFRSIDHYFPGYLINPVLLILLWIVFGLFIFIFWEGVKVAKKNIKSRKK